MGKAKIIKLLVQKGASIVQNSKYGMNVVHFAAQNNQPWAIAYFYEVHRLDLSVKDEDGNTPLHWACHFGSVTAAEFLLKWCPQSLNCKNGAGHTPLHLAVESAIASNSTRLVRVLLFAGASRSITDNCGLKPIDIDPTSPSGRKLNSEAGGELKKMLAEPTECACLMLRIPVKKLEPDKKLTWVFVGLILLSNLVCIAVAIPRMAFLCGHVKQKKT